MPGAIAAVASSPGSLSLLTLQALKGVLLVHPSLWQLLVTVAAPIRLTIAWNLWLGRSLHSLASELARRLLELVGWLSGRAEPTPRLRFWLQRRRLVTPLLAGLRRWHVAAGALVLIQGIRWAAAAWRDAASGKAAQRRELRRRMRTAESEGEW